MTDLQSKARSALRERHRELREEFAKVIEDTLGIEVDQEEVRTGHECVEEKNFCEVDIDGVTLVREAGVESGLWVDQECLCGETLQALRLHNLADLGQALEMELTCGRGECRPSVKAKDLPIPASGEIERRVHRRVEPTPPPTFFQRFVNIGRWLRYWWVP